MRIKNTKLLVSLFAIIPSLAVANAFNVNWQGAKATAMGEAFVAQADDASAVYYNPAGMSQLDGKNIIGGGTIVTTQHKLNTDDDYTYYGKNGIFFVPNVFYTQKINDHISVGAGVYANYGLGTKHGDGFPTKYLLGNKETYVQAASVTSAISYQVTPKLSIAAGGVYQFLELKLKSKVNSKSLSGGVIEQDGEWDFDFDDDGAWGYNLGVLYKANDQFSIGLNYKSKITHDLSGDSKVSIDSALSSISTMLTKDVTASVTMPANASVGVAYKQAQWTIEVDALWVGWSDFDKIYIPELDATALKNYDNTVSYHFGLQYVLSDVVSLRGGFVYDPTPIPSSTLDPTLPSGDRYSTSVGIGFNLKNNWTIDVAYQYIIDKGGYFDNSTGTDSLTGLHYQGDLSGVVFNIIGLSVSKKL